MKRVEFYLGNLTGVLTIFLGMELSRASWLGSRQSKVLHLLPFIAILMFGLACLAKLVFDIVTFKDYTSGAIPELEEDILEARRDLKKRGFKSTTD
jgi:hypothetical protein